MQLSTTLNSTSSDDIEGIFGVIADSIDYIYQGENIYYAKDEKKEELVRFLNNLTSDQFTKLQSFFTTMPKMQTTVEYNCPICGLHHTKVLEGLQSFF